MTDDFIVSYLLFCSDCVMFTEQFFTNHNLHPYQNIVSRLKIVEISVLLQSSNLLKWFVIDLYAFYALNEFSTISYQ